MYVFLETKNKFLVLSSADLKINPHPSRKMVHTTNQGTAIKAGYIGASSESWRDPSTWTDNGVAYTIKNFKGREGWWTFILTRVLGSFTFKYFLAPSLKHGKLDLFLAKNLHFGIIYGHVARLNS